MIVGAYSDDDGGDGAGAVYIIFLQASCPTSLPTAQPTPLPTKSPTAEPTLGPNWWTWSDYFTFSTVSSSASECTTYTSFRTAFGDEGKSISLTASGTTITCSDETTAASIISYWSACTSTYEGDSSSSCTTTSWTCDGYTWMVGLCNGIEICADCSAICTCDSGLSIRPCIGNSNWGGYGTTCSVRPIVCALGSICADRSLLFRRQAAKPCPSRSTLKPRHRYQHRTAA